MKVEEITDTKLGVFHAAVQAAQKEGCMLGGYIKSIPARGAFRYFWVYS